MFYMRHSFIHAVETALFILCKVSLIRFLISYTSSLTVLRTYIYLYKHITYIDALKCITISLFKFRNYM